MLQIDLGSFLEQMQTTCVFTGGFAAVRNVPLAAGVLGAVAALRGAASSSDEASEEPLLSSAFAAGGVLTVLTGFVVLLLASSSELLSLDEDSVFVAGVFAVVEAALPLATG